MIARVLVITLLTIAESARSCVLEERRQWLEEKQKKSVGNLLLFRVALGTRIDRTLPFSVIHCK